MKMLGKPFWRIIFIFLFLSLSSDSFSEMASENYRIRSSVHSAGGVPIGSTNYQLNDTIGQSSPLPDPADPPFSDSYDLYPGFWYTIGASGDACPGDFNGDGDVDGKDLAELAADPDLLGLSAFAAKFGQTGCQ